MRIAALKALSSILVCFCCGSIGLAADRVATHDTGWKVQVCQPPKNLCGRITHELAQGGFLDFRASPNGDHATLRLLSPFAIERIEPLDKSRCPAQLCAAHLALAGLREDLLKQGYYTQTVDAVAGGAVLTLRSERIDSGMKVLKGSCRFDLDPKCSGSGTWLQDDYKSGEKCGFGLTRVFAVTAAPPAFVAAAGFVAAQPMQAAPIHTELPRSLSFDTASVRIYELLYIHKICPSAMTIVADG